MIELMITVVILAVLAAIAIPSYQEHVRKTRRAMVTADLSELAQWLERRHTVNGTYVTPTGQPALPFTTSPRDGTPFYNITVTPAASTFTLRAEPTGAQTNDTRCTTYTLTHTGQRTAGGSAGVDGCW